MEARDIAAGDTIGTANTVLIDREVDARVQTRSSDDMARIAGGTFHMGSDVHYPEEGPAHRVTVDNFWIDRHAVTNADFAAFVAATGYETFAERPLDSAFYPGARPELLTPGSAVFRMPGRPVRQRDLRDWSDMWSTRGWMSLCPREERSPRTPPFPSPPPSFESMPRRRQ
jgi:formylglycine-generating enzyme required for sulfatase activity